MIDVPEKAIEINFDLPEWSQILFKPSRYKIIYGGRGSAKTESVARALLVLGLQSKKRILCCREIQKSIRDSVHKVLADIVNANPAMGYEAQREVIINRKNGTEFIFKGLRANIQQIKSLQGIDYAWVEEAHGLTEESIEVLTPTVRNNNSEIWFTYNRFRNSEPVHDTFVAQNHPDALILKVNFDDNPFFPEVLRKEMERDKATNLLKYNHKWLGEPITKIQGALWTYDFIKYDECVDFKRIVISIDPAITANVKSDETGIVVAGEAHSGIFYILEDGSMKGSPNEWAMRACNLFDKWKADRIVVEVNQGGDMVRSILSRIRPSIPITEVRATRGKITRAEPIAALYEQGKVKHCEPFPILEEQLTTFTGQVSDKSPDRLDALVWALTDLSGKSPKVVNVTTF